MLSAGCCRRCINNIIYRLILVLDGNRNSSRGNVYVNLRSQSFKNLIIL